MLVTFLQTVEDPLPYGWSAAIVETAFDVVFLMDVCVRWCCALNRVSFVLISHAWFDILAPQPPQVNLAQEAAAISCTKTC